MPLVDQAPSHLAVAHFNTQVLIRQIIQVDSAQLQVKNIKSIPMDKILLGQLALQAQGAHSLSQEQAHSL